MKWPPDNLEELLERGAEVLRSFGAKEVYVFGSAATGRMHARSDVDLAVSGLPDRNFIRALVKLSDVFERPVDLIDIDEVSPFTKYLKEEDELRRVA